ncbi:hypothetical protein HKCCE4037_13730, partial [Rhodobacterales bacterium HKCCE4037]|nr:hypothetical protein [Rhodobacterales bacterium HKCCE4037]
APVPNIAPAIAPSPVPQPVAGIQPAPVIAPQSPLAQDVVTIEPIIVEPNIGALGVQQFQVQQ